MKELQYMMTERNIKYTILCQTSPLVLWERVNPKICRKNPSESVLRLCVHPFRAKWYYDFSMSSNCPVHRWSMHVWKFYGTLFYFVKKDIGLMPSISLLTIQKLPNPFFLSPRTRNTACCKGPPYPKSFLWRWKCRNNSTFKGIQRCFYDISCGSKSSDRRKSLSARGLIATLVDKTKLICRPLQ